MQKITRKWFPLATLAVVLCAVVAWTRAEEKMSGDHMMKGDSMKMSPEETKMAGDQMDKMKTMATDHPQDMAADVAKLLVMDKMAMQMSMDPSFMASLRQSMSDPNMKSVHEDAQKMADDPAQMAKIRDEIMADPKAMHMVMHQAAMMSSMHGGMMHQGMMTDEKMKEMPTDKK
jgi:hypothetical protein